MAVVWKVYVPHELFNQSESFLFGHVNLLNQSAYITASSCNSAVANQLQGQMQLLGNWTESKSSLKQGTNKEHIWINISKTKGADILCNIFHNDSKVLCTCVIYNPAELLKSAVLYQKAETAPEPTDNITALVKSLKQSETCLSEYQTSSEIVSYCGHKLKNTISDHVTVFLVAVLYLFYFPFKRLGAISDSKYWSTTTTGNLLGSPACFTQLGNRAQKLVIARKACWTNYDRLWTVNLCVTQILDTVLGVALMYFLMSNNMAQYLANICLAHGDKVADELKGLLDWLMGAPAGLKLNSQLTHFLGKFFQYHIYLWTGYLSVIRPFLGGLLYYCSIAGVLGLTVQLALFQDVFSTMTIHIYCFYVYAARLYRLQMYALASLWRLFRGKKWNVLRQRVDSAVYDANQLFVGTLLFTVLLFLVPTTALYYVVFTLLRILVLAIQGSVYRIRNIINTTPWWSIFKWLAKSPSLLDGAVFSVVSSSNSCLVLSMQGTRPSLTSVMTLPTNTTDRKTSYSWGTIIGNLFHGDLIYPWIERKK